MATKIEFPNESSEYRKARNELLDAEIELRAQIDKVAEHRRALPPGGKLKEDYVFDEYVDGRVVQTKFSDLFQPGTDTLFFYSFMFSPDMDAPCPGCTDTCDALDAHVRHIEQRISIAAVAKNPIGLFHAHARSRGWQDLRLLSSENNSYQKDYHGEVNGNQITIANVFKRDGEDIRHFWSSELVYASSPDGWHPRHIDVLRPLWGVLDMTPGGRGDFDTSLSYG